MQLKLAAALLAASLGAAAQAPTPPKSQSQPQQAQPPVSLPESLTMRAARRLHLDHRNV